jgi:hypothetical protein
MGADDALSTGRSPWGDRVVHPAAEQRFELRRQWAVIDGVGPIRGVTPSNGQVLRIGEF